MIPFSLKKKLYFNSSFFNAYNRYTSLRYCNIRRSKTTAFDRDYVGVQCHSSRNVGIGTKERFIVIHTIFSQRE